MLHVLYELQHLLLLKGHTRVLKRVVGPPIHQPQLISNKNTIFFFLNKHGSDLVKRTGSDRQNRVGDDSFGIVLYYILK